jgi:hypothetical protein
LGAQTVSSSGSVWRDHVILALDLRYLPKSGYAIRAVYMTFINRCIIKAIERPNTRNAPLSPKPEDVQIV